MRKFSLLLLLLPSWTYGQGEDFLVHPYLQHGTPSAMRILWETETPRTTWVRYGIPGWHTEVARLDQELKIPGFRTFHEVHLEGLLRETTYLYQVLSMSENGDTLKSAVRTFKTAVRPDQAFSFVVFSDSQSNPEVWKRVSEGGFKERPDFGLHAGDLVGLGYLKDDWVNEFFAPSRQFMGAIPLFTVPGNHEHDAALYYQYMSNPEPEYRYTFDYGNARYFMVDSNRPVHKGSDQYTWLERELALSTQTWNFVVHHHPPYSSEENDFGDTHVEQSLFGDPDLKDLIHLYEKYGVDMVFYGHIHTYERTWPLLQNRVNQNRGVIYINTGGAGGGLEKAAPYRVWFTQKVRTTHHFCYVTVHENTLNFQAIDENGQLFDQFTISKQGKKEIIYTEPPAPVLSTSERVFEKNLSVVLSPVFEDMDIHYTLDGTDPGISSPKYTGNILISQSAVLKAAAFKNTLSSPVVTATFTKDKIHEAVKVAVQPGLNYVYYTSQEVRRLPFDAYERKVENSGTVRQLLPQEVAHRAAYFGIRFEGFIEVKERGLYTFSGHADDKLQVYVHEKLILDEDREEINKEGQILLEAGLHPFRVEYFNERDHAFLELSISGPGLPKQSISPFMLKRK
jgi:predicted phosphodiesterase